MSPAKTSPSTRRLSEVARHVIIPSGIVTTGWPAVESRCREFGDTFDTWQANAGQVFLGKRADGMYAATVGGIGLSIPRQVAKTFLVGRTVFGLSCEFPGLRTLWSAHRTRTATNTFQALQGYAQRKKVAPFIGSIRKTNGEQEIEFANGSRIMFGARELGFGRGFDEVDIEVFDEAQILGLRALEDMVAATNQSRHPHGALLFFMGTPPRPVDPGEAFTVRRTEALAGETTDALWIECGADQDAKLDDQKQWAKANPSFPHRTPLQSMLRLRKNLPDDDSWRREALGIWDETKKANAVVTPGEWQNAGDTTKSEFVIGGRVLAFEVNQDRTWSAVGWVGDRGEVLHSEIVDSQYGTGWVADRIVRYIQGAGDLVRGVAYVSGAPGESLVPDVAKALKAAGIEIELTKITATQFTAGCGDWYDKTVGGTLRHVRQDWLTKAVESAEWVDSGKSRRLIGEPAALAVVTALQGFQTIAESDVQPPMFAFT